MGCAPSKVGDYEPSNKPSKGKGKQSKDRSKKKSYEQTINELCSHARLEVINEVQKLQVESKRNSLALNYCYLSQRGYYPNALGKANQDSYTICENILGEKNCHLFGIFDGHGEFGDYCSHYCAEKVPFYLQKLLGESGGTVALDGKDMEAIFVDAFLKANTSLHKSKIDDSLSGTTGIIAVIRGDLLYICNVGDSRAIIASDVDGFLKYSPLSSDQTPFRKDERARLKHCGAYIMTLEQIEGREPIHENWDPESGDTIDESGDPPRVWDKTLEKPGCAFTRSLGDAVGESVGICAEPEILTWEITSNDRYIILASDGVFEFLTSQNVVNIISQYPNIIDGARRVIEESYRLWLTYDERTDDISIIIISIEKFTAKRIIPINAPTIPQSSRLMRLDSSRSVSMHSCSVKSIRSNQLPENKPVRRVISKTRRKEIAENWVKNGIDDFDFSKHIIRKSPEELARISELVKSNFIFENLFPVQRDQIFQVMQITYVNAGQTIIKQGDEGDEMYIVDSGEFIVTKRDETGVAQTVLTYCHPGASFGELSLMYGKPRAASVKAKTDGRLWVLCRQAFRSVLIKRKQEDLLSTIRSIPIISDLSFTQLQRLCEQTTEIDYNDGDIIYEVEAWSSPPQSNKIGNVGDSTAMQGMNYAISTTHHDPKKWIICIILSGQIRFVSKDHQTFRFRGIRSCIVDIEIDKFFSRISAEGKTKVSFISYTSFQDIAGEKIKRILLENVIARASLSPTITPRNATVISPSSSLAPHSNKFKRVLSGQDFSCGYDESVEIKNEVYCTDYKLSTPVALVGDFGYLATFLYQGSVGIKGSRFTGKVIAKKRATLSNMDSRMLQEKQFLQALKGECFCIPIVSAIIPDSKTITMIYTDYYTCDLSSAISSGILTDKSRIWYLACIYSAIKALHSCGLMHRFINPGSIFITDRGIAKVVDMRYAKKMNGSLSFTICGDPSFLAPEMITSQGYNYAVDLWSLGIVAFELYEGKPPFGTEESEETALFKEITEFKYGDLKFSKKTSENVRDLIRTLLYPDISRRLGYRTSTEVLKHPCMIEIKWDAIGSGAGYPANIQPTIDPASVFSDADLEEYNSAIFDRF